MINKMTNKKVKGFTLAEGARRSDRRAEAEGACNIFNLSGGHSCKHESRPTRGGQDTGYNATNRGAISRPTRSAGVLAGRGNMLPTNTKGFTLAELLITLGVIGVVAAMTIPLLTKITNAKYVAKLKKYQSILAQATYAVSEDLGGSPNNWGLAAMPGTTGRDPNEVIEAYKKWLKFSDYKATNGISNSHIRKYLILGNTYLQLNGEKGYRPPTSAYPTGPYGEQTTYIFEMKDGAIVSFRFAGSDWNVANAVCYLTIQVDLNGFEKPNTYGRDVFLFGIHRNGKFFPYNIDNYSDCNKNGSGYSCAGRIIKEGKMNY